MRYAYALATSLLLGGAAATMVLHTPAGAQTAQNEPGAIQAAAPKAGAPMSFADMVAKLQPAVVNISTTQRVQVQQTNPFAGTPFGQLFGFGDQPQQGAPQTREAESLGSGFVISADGYVVTNNHVISAGERGAVVESIKVTLADGRNFKAKLVGHDAQSDLALLKVDGVSNLPFVRFGDSKAARVGDWVVAIGNPYGLGGSVTAGIISAVHRVTGNGAFDRFIQTDASINHGNSGGPMFDLNGNVIGINSQIISPTGVNIGIGLAIPAEEAKPIIDKLMKGTAIKRGYLGVSMQDLTDDIADALGIEKGKGTLVRTVTPGEAADKAGIKQGDVIVGVNGKEVTQDNTLSYLVANVTPGTRVPIDVIRNGKRLTIQVTVGTRPTEEQLAAANFDSDEDGDGNGNGNGGSAAPVQSASLGIAVLPLTPAIAQNLGIDPSTHGVVINDVSPSSDAASKGLRRGDVIVSVNQTPINNAGDLAKLVGASKSAGRGSVLLYVQRRNIGAFVPVDIAS